jgi:hypothetical protein
MKISKNTLLQQQIICFTPRVKVRRACSRALEIPASKSPMVESIMITAQSDWEVPVSNHVLDEATVSRDIINEHAVALGCLKIPHGNLSALSLPRTHA